MWAASRVKPGRFFAFNDKGVTKVELFAPVSLIKGIGPARAAALLRAGVSTAGDLLTYFPRAYEDRSVVKKISDTVPLESCTVIAAVITAPEVSRIRGGLVLLRFKISDGSGVCTVTYFNQSYLKTKFIKGETYSFYGRFEGNLITRSLANPAAERASPESEAPKSAIVPIYPLVKGLTQKSIISAVGAVLDSAAEEIKEPLPPELLAARGLMARAEAIKKIHRPASVEEALAARNRLIFDELLSLQLGLFALKDSRRSRAGAPCRPIDLEEFVSSLPFKLTAAQRRCIDEGVGDLLSGIAMNRLVQGDVGSGKTAVAAALCWYAAKNGYQAGFLAPTEILARQHYENLMPLFGALGLRCGILTGGTRKAQREPILADLCAGEIDVMIGTHALLEEEVEFSRLGLIVCDEQHRFGVLQRAAATLKGDSPHTLVMSATPIPRTLALAIYGDLDVSVVDELPPGRQKTVTHLVGEEKRAQVERFIAGKLSEGRQGYIVCPLVEESELAAGLKDALGHADELKKKFSGYGISVIHGKLSAAKKAEEMEAFRTGQTRLLVATTVIEVGIDVKNATFMVIENAERFGLSQLHQLRGRVGRGSEKSYCILVSASKDPETNARLKAMTETSDGFELARIDLELRGPGDFFGSRQHGLPVLKIADMAGDSRQLYEAAQAAKEIIEADPSLSLPKHAVLKEHVEALFSPERGNLFN